MSTWQPGDVVRLDDGSVWTCHVPPDGTTYRWSPVLGHATTMADWWIEKHSPTLIARGGLPVPTCGHTADIRELAEQLGAVDDVCYGLEAGIAATKSRDFGRGVSHAVSAVRSASQYRVAAGLPVPTGQDQNAATSRPLESWQITPTCRFNRGNDGAWDEAVDQLRQVYDAQVARFGPTAALTLSLTRARAVGVTQAAYNAMHGVTLR